MTTILQQQTIAAMPGNWSASLSFNQFDPSAGNLIDAVFTTAGTIDVSASIENLSPAAANVYLGVSAAIDASAPGVGQVASLAPYAGSSVNLGGFQGTFDGTLNFGGPSGTVLADFGSSQTQTTVIQAGTDGSLPFLGSGTFDVAVSSHATATVTGNANFAVQLHASEGAVVSLGYDAVAPVSGTPPGAAAGAVIDVGYWPEGPWIAYGPLEIVTLVTTVPQVVTLPSQTTGWSGAASFDQFNPVLGTLVGIILNVGNTVAGTFSAENLENTPGSIAMSESGSLTVTAPGIAATAHASASDGFSLAGFDGSADFSGSSGRSDTTGSVSGETGNTTLNDNADVTAFTGNGVITLPVSTSGLSSEIGPANLLSEITQHMGGTVSVSYVYSPGPVGITLSSPASSDTGSSPVYPVLFGQSAGLSVHQSSTGQWADSAPRMTFIGGLADATSVTARGDETFLIAPGASATIAGFSLTDGDRLDVSGLLRGAALANDLSTLDGFLSVTGTRTDAGGGIDTMLSVHGPGGAATLALTNDNPIATADLLNAGALVLSPR